MNAMGVARMRKGCTRCGEKTDNFGPDKRRTDGLQSHCRPCKARAQLLYGKRPEIAKRNRILGRLRRLSDPSFQKKSNAKLRKWRKKNEETLRAASRLDRAGRLKLRLAARNAVNNALRDGRITKDPCEKCGTTSKVHAHHHHGYSSKHRLDVRWLCARCHAFEHWPLENIGW